MKSFSQFLEESYLTEDEADQLRLLKRDNKTPYNFRKNTGNKGVSKDPTPSPVSRRLPAGSPDNPRTSPGQLEISQAKKAQERTKRKPSGAARDPWKQFPKKPERQLGLPKEGPSSRVPGKLIKPAGGTNSRPALPPKGQTGKQGPGKLTKRPTSTLTKTPQQTVKVVDLDSQRRRDARVKQRRASAGTGPSGKAIITPPPKNQIQSTSGTQGKPPTSQPKPPQSKMPTGAKPTGKFGKLGKFGKALGPAATALDVGLSTADERAKGSGWKRSLAKGSAVAAGGLAGGALGAIGGGGIGSAALGTAGAIGGAEAAGKAFDVVAGANAKERKAMARKNRQRQAGSALKGIGGKTTFDTKKNTMTTGTGSQRKTVKLGKTGVVQRGGKSVAGHLAYKDGKAVYKAGPSAQSLAKTSSNPLERIGRTLFAGAYKKHDAAKAKQALQKAKQSDASRNKALGVKFKPGG